MFISKKAFITTAISPLLFVRTCGLDSSGCNECTIAGKTGQSQSFCCVEDFDGRPFELVFDDFGNAGSTIKHVNQNDGDTDYEFPILDTSSATEVHYGQGSRLIRISFQETTDPSENNVVLSEDGIMCGQCEIAYVVGCMCPPSTDPPSSNPSSNPSALPEDDNGGDNNDTGGDNNDTGGDNNDPGGDNNDPGGDNDDNGGDNNDTGGDNDDNGGDNNDTGGDNDDNGGDNNDTGGDNDGDVESNCDCCDCEKNLKSYVKGLLFA